MKKINQSRLSDINGGSMDSFIDGVCDATAAAGIASSVLGVLTGGVGFALLVSVGAACFVRGVGRYL